MKIEEAISILKTHNEWRRGADIPMTDVTVLGEAIDCVVKAAEKWERFYEADMLFKKIRKAGIDLKTDIGLAIKKELSYRHEKDIDKACEWIRKYYRFADKEYVDEMIDDFTKHMGATLEKSKKPTNLTWHKVSDGDLPEDGQLVLISNPAIQFAIYKKVFHPVMRFGRKFEIDDSRLFAGVEYWMNIPEIPMKHETR